MHVQKLAKGQYRKSAFTWSLRLSVPSSWWASFMGHTHLFRRAGMILRLLLCASSAAAALQVAPAPLLAPRGRPRMSPALAMEISLFDQFKERMTQLADLRIARASHILVKGNDTATLEQLAEWKREIGDDEEKFAELAREHSTCRSRTRGGDLGYFPRGKMARQLVSRGRHLAGRARRGCRHGGVGWRGRSWAMAAA